MLKYSSILSLVAQFLSLGSTKIIFIFLAWQELKKSGPCSRLSRLEGGQWSAAAHIHDIFALHISVHRSHTLCLSGEKKKKDLFIELLKHKDLTPTLIFAFHASEKDAIKH